jgi:hypothetical protein
MSRNEKGLGALFAGVIADLQSVIRNQIELAMAEIAQSVKRALRASVAFMFAMLLLVTSIFLLIIAFGFGMAALGVPEWLAFLLLAGACILIAGLLLLLSGRNAKKINGPRLALRSFERTNNAVAETIAHVRD